MLSTEVERARVALHASLNKWRLIGVWNGRDPSVEFAAGFQDVDTWYIASESRGTEPQCARWIEGQALRDVFGELAEPVSDDLVKAVTLDVFGPAGPPVEVGLAIDLILESAFRLLSGREREAAGV